MMVRTDAIFNAADGLSPDIAAKLVQRAEKYKSSLCLEYGDRRIQLDSLIGILSMELYRGRNFSVIAEGEDEGAAAEDIRRLLAGA